MNVLYVNHTAEVSGGERSLLGLLAALPPEVSPCVATPPGPLAERVAALGIPTARIAGTAGSLRLHPLHTPRALGELTIATAQVRRAAARHRAQIVHANSIRAGIVACLGASPARATVAHVRDCLPPGLASTATLRLLGARASVVVTNSDYTARSVLAVAPRARVEVIYNALDTARWDPALIDRTRARAALGRAGERALLLGVVAQITPWKGQDTAIEALALLCEQGIDAHLLLVGSAKFRSRATRFDNERYAAELRERIARAGLEERVSWLGEREDVAEIVRALDVLLLPSWEEPFGRALIEAMALGVPVVATSVGGPPELVQDGVQGHLAAPREPAAWARAIAHIAGDRELAARMGAAGRRTVAERFAMERQLAAILDLYRALT